MLTANEIAESFSSETISETISLIEKEEAHLIKEYGVTNIDEVLAIQKKQLKNKNNYRQQIIEKSDKIIKELGAKDIYEALEIVKKNKFEGANKLDLSKIPDDVLDMAIKIREKELEESK